ncbi:MAG: hypothetical protein ACR2JB_04020 [Bryobacteraceae bacterium]
MELAKLTDQELEELQELYTHTTPEQVDAIESRYISGVAEQNAAAIWDKVATRSKRPK